MITGWSEETGPQKSPRLHQIASVDGFVPAARSRLISFHERHAVNPSNWLRLENGLHHSNQVAMRVLDLLCPIGLGQRALIAAPPRAGKTTLLTQIAESIAANHPNVELKMLLVDERPEEVTDFRSLKIGEVFASTLDQRPADHARLSQLALDHCVRSAEAGKDIFLIVDSLTRMTRAFNKLATRGPIGAGGLNVHALDTPKRIFASARPFAEGGSLSIVASVLIETGNRMDEVIFREFKGTGNLDIVLDPWLADHRIWPALDIAQSMTRRVELLQPAETLRATTALRNALMRMPNHSGMEELVTKLKRFPSNEAFLALLRDSSLSTQG